MKRGPEDQAASDAADRIIGLIDDQFRAADFRTRTYVFNDLFVLCTPLDIIAICGSTLARLMAHADPAARAKVLEAINSNVSAYADEAASTPKWPP